MQLVLLLGFGFLCLPAHAGSCTTRADCNSTSVCEGTAVEGITISKQSGICVPCNAYAKASCPSPCRVTDDHQCSADSLAMHARLDFEPPVYFQLISGVVKPALTLAVFGGSKPTSLLACGAKVAAQLAFLGMAIHTAVLDVTKILQAAKDVDSWWTIYLTICLVLLNSSNIASGASAFSLRQSLWFTKNWVEAHSDPASRPPPPMEPVKHIYLFLMTALLAVSIVVSVPVMVVSIIYIWVWFLCVKAMGLIIKILSRRLLKLSVCCKSRAAQSGESLLGKDTTVDFKRHALKCMPMGDYTQYEFDSRSELGKTLRRFDKMSDEEVSKRYADNDAYFDKFGVPQMAFFGYCNSVHAAYLGFIASVTCHFLAHLQYLPPLTSALLERGFWTYLTVALASFSSSVGFVWLLL